MMDCTYGIAMTYHIEFRAKKMKSSQKRKKSETHIQLIEIAAEEIPRYECLREIIDNKSNLKDHMDELEVLGIHCHPNHSHRTRT